MAVVIVQITAVRVGDLELHPGQRLVGLLVQLLHHDGALLVVVKTEGLRLTDFDLDGFRGGVEDIALQRLDLLGGDGHAGFQALNHDAAILIGDILAIGTAYHLTVGFRHQESYPFQRVRGAGDILLNHQLGLGVIFKGQVVAAAIVPGVGRVGTAAVIAAGQAVGPVLHDDGLGRCIQHIAVGDFALVDHNGAARYKSCDRHGAVFAGGVAAQHIPVPILHGKLGIGDGLAGHGVQLGQGQTAQGFIQER